MQFKEESIFTMENVLAFIGRTFIIIALFCALGAINLAFAKTNVTVVAPQACTQGLSPLAARQMLLAQLNGIWVVNRRYERMEPTVVPLDYAGVSSACPFGRGFVKMRITNNGKTNDMWCDIRRPSHNANCFTKAEMVKQRRGDEAWLNGASVCDPQVREPMPNFWTVPEEELEF